MNLNAYARQSPWVYVVILVILGALALGLKVLGPLSGGHPAGWINIAVGGMLLSAFVIGRVVSLAGLPMLSGYLFAGILAGPFVSGMISPDTVEQLKLMDELALSIIAMAAGAELPVAAVRKRTRSILLHILSGTVLVIVLVAGLVWFLGPRFEAVSGFNAAQLAVFAALTGVICVARSPSSAIALINECRAAGPFTEMILSVTLLTDILIIILFTVTLAVSRQFLSEAGGLQWMTAGVLGAEIVVSLGIGAILGKGISLYIRRVGHDVLIFLLFIAFGVSRAAIGFNAFMAESAHGVLHLEPLLICMSAGFFIRNYTGQGPVFLESLDRIALPVYVLFFSLAGAALDFGSLARCWPLALGVVLVRAAGLFGGSWAAGRVMGEPKPHQRCAWMTYMTQAGVAIGLAQLVMREFPDIGIPLNTVVLAVIAINQIAGPVLFKAALFRVREAGAGRHKSA